MPEPKRVLIVGGVAGGASAAARVRRLDEFCEIVVFDKGPYVSFANCGLPYFVGDVIHDVEDLIVATPDLFRERFDIDVRTRCEVLSIDPAERTIRVRNHTTGEARTERYDQLLLSPGASPIKPPLEGIDLPGVFSVRTIPDSERIRAWIDARSARRAVVVGGGFIGLEMAENLAHRGLEVAIVERAEHVMPPIDVELAATVEQRMRAQGVDLRLGDGVARFTPSDRGLTVHTASGAALDADLVILAIGVKPQVELARDAGIELGPRGGIRVDERMRTSAPNVWAVGDAVETREAASGADILLPLAGPANRQGRIAANDMCGRASRFRGVQGTAVCGAFGLTIAATGCSEAELRRRGDTDFEAVHLHPGHHVGYFPGARPIHLKLLFRRSDGVVLGAQAVGEEGVARRIDVVATALQLGATVFDLEEAELCYAPQFGAAKDPVNLAGMIAANIVRGDLEVVHWTDGKPCGLLLDVRSEEEFAAGAVPGAVNIPLETLRDRLDEVPVDTSVAVYCEVGQRAYYATRMLVQRGRRAVCASGGYTTWVATQP